MALELRQQLKLSQQLVMTPQLQQAIKLLQLSRLELIETVQQELLENPFLEEGMEEVQVETPDALDERPVANTDDAAVNQDLTRNADWEDYLGEFSSTSKQVQYRESETPEEGVSFEARLTHKPSLEGHLHWQLRLSSLSPRQIEIGEAIIGNLDSTGYLQATDEDIAGMTGSSVEEVAEVIYAVNRFDPVGVAARSPQECLLVQLEVLGNDDPLLTELVRDHLEDLEKRRYKPLCRKFKISMEQLKDCLDRLQKLDPMPGASFGSGEPQYVSPDVNVFKYGDEFVIVLNDEGFPKLELNCEYVEHVKARNEEEKNFFQEKIRAAQWLMKSLYQRQRTLFKVTESIVRHQRDFFEEGVTRLKPLILKDIAEDIGMHESTVSRITTSKYLSCQHGIFELKFFFNSALSLDDGSEVGSESVKATIKQLIGDEDPKKPLSDEKIAEILKDKLQVNIARRTVAKYRTALDIPSSSKRKAVF